MDGILPTPAIALSDAALLAEVVACEATRRLADARAVELAGEVAWRSRWELGGDSLSAKHGQRRPAALIEELTRVSGAEAARRVRLGEELGPRRGLAELPLPPRFPRVAAAVADGSIGRDAATAIVQCLAECAARVAPDDLATAELMLVDRAVSAPADTVAEVARLTRDYLDADGAEPRDAALRRRRSFRIGREHDGMVRFGGYADPVSAATLRGALDGARGDRPRFQPDPGPDLPADDRTREQRDLDLLVGLVTAGAETTGAREHARATVIATVTLGDLRSGRGVGRIDGIHEPVWATTIAALACDGELQLLLLGTRGEPLKMGRADRGFTRAQRRALAARDGGCVWPLCTVRASLCDAHHIVEWSRSGPTDIDNGALLCAAHHHALHATGARLRSRNGRPELETAIGWIPLRGRYALAPQPAPMRT